MENEEQQDAISFESHIRPLFREKDVESMRRARQFDLSDYGDVSARAQDILGKLEQGVMPCDGAWPKDNVDLFRRWMEQGRQP